ncbi:hypothetical protein LMG27174_01659 [Paraburkholderia rhynchosiae]|uniref:Uncharacterized protein n=1 Tax=Paraburkholderia rhynchosiae TaxID=487049 RepID=A0A6J5AAX4_9BURK|nr:hypothetical protein LMG27174_01659 [Paraburkholderia rhynchosiae]
MALSNGWKASFLTPQYMDSPLSQVLKIISSDR